MKLTVINKQRLISTNTRHMFLRHITRTFESQLSTEAQNTELDFTGIMSALYKLLLYCVLQYAVCKYITYESSTVHLELCIHQ